MIGWIDGDVLGLAAANWLTELGWGIAAVLLVLNVFAPRVGEERHDHVAVDRDRDGVDDRHERREPVIDRDRDGVDDREERPVVRS